MNVQHEQSEVNAANTASSIESARNISKSMANSAQGLAANPWKNLKTYIQYKLLMFFVNRPRMISTRRHQKYTRLAARRDPARFSKFVDNVSEIKTMGSSVVMADSQRAAEFCEYDPNLKPLDSDIRLIAFYLPQYHPFPENDAWWGKGFTEWTNVGKALPSFQGHYQPHCPIHLGYYDLRLPEIMEEQAKIARQYGVGGFAHHFYWFGGRTLMETPLLKMLQNPTVDIPFCISWANENWTRRWDGKDQEVLIAQSYSTDDARQMIRHLANYFNDARYIRINGRPVFMVYNPNTIPDVQKMKDIWQDEAKNLGIGPLYLIGAQKSLEDDFQQIGFDGSVQFPPHGMDGANLSAGLQWLKTDVTAFVYDYEKVSATALSQTKTEKKQFWGVTLSWDNTARRQKSATVIINFSIKAYRNWLSELCQRLRQDPTIVPDEKIIFINAWNEWAEGTHLEPDQRFGFAYLEATRQALTGPA